MTALCDFICVYVTRKERRDTVKAGFDCNFPSRDNGNRNKTLSCCVKETTSAPVDGNDLDVHINSCSYTPTGLRQSSNLLIQKFTFEET